MASAASVRRPGERRRAALAGQTPVRGAGRTPPRYGRGAERAGGGAGERAGGSAGERAREEPAGALIGGGYRQLIRR